MNTELIENQDDFDINSIAKKYSISNEIKINPEYEKILPALTNTEYNSLKSLIRERGENLAPIIVNQQGEILDGHHEV